MCGLSDLAQFFILLIRPPVNMASFVWTGDLIIVLHILTRWLLYIVCVSCIVKIKN